MISSVQTGSMQLNSNTIILTVGRHQPAILELLKNNSYLRIFSSGFDEERKNHNISNKLRG